MSFCLNNTDHWYWILITSLNLFLLVVNGHWSRSLFDCWPAPMSLLWMIYLILFSWISDLIKNKSSFCFSRRSNISMNSPDFESPRPSSVTSSHSSFSTASSHKYGLLQEICVGEELKISVHIALEKFRMNEEQKGMYLLSEAHNALVIDHVPILRYLTHGWVAGVSPVNYSFVTLTDFLLCPQYIHTSKFLF